MADCLLVASAAYMDAEFTAEFGRLVPAFLPVANRRLFEWQFAPVAAHSLRREPPAPAKSAKDSSAASQRRFLSIPADFVLDESDKRRLSELQVELIRVPLGLSLGESLVHCLHVVNAAGDSVEILLGDTLIFDVPEQPADGFSVGEIEDFYHWDVVDSEGELPDNQVFSGFLRISKPGELVNSVSNADGNLISALKNYRQRVGSLQPMKTGLWLDFGHMHTYYRSRARLTTQRVFNSMQITDRCVIKQSDWRKKMQAETHWFQQLPAELRIFTPHYIGQSSEADRQGYRLEYLYLTPLNELLVFGRLPDFIWRQIFSACTHFMASCRAFLPPTGQRPEVSKLYLPKTKKRLAQFAESSGLDLQRSWEINGQKTPGLIDIAKQAASLISEVADGDLCWVHGDFCASNILYDFRTQAIRVIDPRGIDANEQITAYGDQRYDIAKLAHSFIGGYDHIVAGRFQLKRDGDYKFQFALDFSVSALAAQQAFKAIVVKGKSLDEQHASAIMVLLFLSMLPLHYDSPARQNALLANALRLFLEIREC